MRRRLVGTRESLLAALLLVLAVGCSSNGGLPPFPKGGFDDPVTVVFEGAPPIRATVARRPDQRARGLMRRRVIQDGTGMVFLYPKPVETAFWMKETLVPLSIAYVNADRVVSTAEMVPCRADPCATYPPAGPYTFAVEAPAGFFPVHGVRAGTRVRIQGSYAPPVE